MTANSEGIGRSLRLVFDVGLNGNGIFSDRRVRSIDEGSYALMDRAGKLPTAFWSYR